MPYSKEKTLIFKKAIASSMVSKVVSMVFQVISVPLLLSFLGAEGFGLYSTLVALFGWVFLISGGINPGITRIVARGGINAISQRFINTAKKINITLICFVIIVFAILYLFSDSSTFYLFSYHHVFTMLLFCLPIIYYSLTDSIRQGMGEQHYNNLWASLATFISIIFIYLLSFSEFSTELAIHIVIFAIYFPILVSKLLNTFYLNRNKTVNLINDNLGERKQTFRLYKVLTFITLSNLLIQLSVIVNKSVVMVTMANFSLIDTAKLELVFRFFMLAGTFFATIQQPLWPMITQAIKSKNNTWVEKIRNKLFVSFLFYSFILMICVVLFGELAFKVWSNGEFHFSELELSLMSIYFITIALNQACIVMLMGYGVFTFIGKALIIESIVLVFLISSNLFEYSVAGIMVAMIVARISTSSIILFLGVKRRDFHNAK